MTKERVRAGLRIPYDLNTWLIQEAGGKYRVRVKEQYNKSPMIQN